MITKFFPCVAFNRIGRLHYLTNRILCVFILLLAMLFFTQAELLSHSDAGLNKIIVAALLCVAISMSIFYIISMFKLAVRRFQDLDYSWRCAFLVFIPFWFITLPVEIFLVIFSGTKGCNSYGEAPLPFTSKEFMRFCIKALLLTALMTAVYLSIRS